MLLTQSDENIFQRRSDLVDIDLSDADATQCRFNILRPHSIIYEKVHRLTENRRTSHSGNVMRCFKRGGDVVASDVQPPGAGWTNFRKSLQFVRFAADDQFGHINVADVIASFRLIHVMSGDEQGHAFAGKTE